MTHSIFTRTAIALSAAAILAATPLTAAMAENNKARVQESIELDEKPTSGIARQLFCDPKSPNATAMCKITNGDPNAQFPSAPVTSFGF